MARHETVYAVWNHVYEVQEQAWLFYRERSQNNGYFGGELLVDWLGMGREGNFKDAEASIWERKKH